MTQYLHLLLVHLQSIHQRFSLQPKGLHQIATSIAAQTLSYFRMQNTAIYPSARLITFGADRTQRYLLMTILIFDKTLRIDGPHILKRHLRAIVLIGKRTLLA